MAAAYGHETQKFLSKINLQQGYPSLYYCFHGFHGSGATLAHRAHVPIEQIKHHGTWTSDCIYAYIKKDHQFAENIATSMAKMF